MRIIGMLGMLLLALAFTGCGTVGHDRAGIANFDRVSPTLFRGAQPTENGFRALAADHVKTVINLRDGDDTLEAKEVHDAGMAYIRIPLDAQTVTVADAQHFLDLLATTQGPVFVHCLVGRDRTGLAVAAYRIRVEGWTLDAAIKDLYDHGHFWVFFPKVRESLAALAQMSSPAMPAIASSSSGTLVPTDIAPARSLHSIQPIHE